MYVTKQQKKIVAVAYNKGYVTEDDFNRFYSDEKSKKAAKKRLTQLRILKPAATNYIFRKSNIDTALSILEYRSQSGNSKRSKQKREKNMITSLYINAEQKRHIEELYPNVSFSKIVSNLIQREIETHKSGELNGLVKN